ncbi:MAG: glutaredoxin family protein [Candidatus Brockarchaeota archaeon]|nr:glutaredoxin family protein [Candidatus Brockarchaeota archaeon]
MKTVKVPGEKREHEVLMYAISTCAWCKRTKKFLVDKGIEYEYVDVDLCEGKDREEILKDISRRGGQPAYPTLIVDGKTLITGFDEEKIRKVLGI